MTDQKLRIAHVAPLFASVPPKAYGGTERVLESLINEQVLMGHDVTLFASGDSKTQARLKPVIDKAIWNQKGIDFPNAYHTIELDMVAKMSEEFDIIHSHFNFIHFQSLHQIKTPMITTLHWRVDLKEFQDLFSYFKDAPLIAISKSQKSYIPNANVKEVIYHGFPINAYQYNDSPDNYIAFVGRFNPEKGAHIAIEVASRAGMKIKLAARMPDDKKGMCYFHDKIEPLLAEPNVEYLGELGEEDKKTLLMNAKLTLVPTSWPEPFGLVTVESLLCGTPVIAFPLGGTGEIVESGLNGFAVENVNEMVKAVGNIAQISRKACRKYAEERFSVHLMTEKYINVYKKVINEWRISYGV